MVVLVVVVLVVVVPVVVVVGPLLVLVLVVVIWSNPNFKNCLETSVFNTFDLDMCFEPQLRALFRHRSVIES